LLLYYWAEADAARHVDRGQASYFGSGARPGRPKPKAQRAESGGGVLRRGQPVGGSGGAL